MRDIKFRGQIQGSKEWVYGDLVINKPSQTYRIFTDFSNIKHGNHTEDSLHVCGGKLQLINYKTLDQFTGLIDKNGKEIYEGDILKTSCQQIRYIKKPNIHGLGSKTKTIKTEGVVTCKWIGYGFKFVHDNETKHTSDINTFEIIGNIHEDNNLISH